MVIGYYTPFAARFIARSRFVRSFVYCAPARTRFTAAAARRRPGRFARRAHPFRRPTPVGDPLRGHLPAARCGVWAPRVRRVVSPPRFADGPRWFESRARKRKGEGYNVHGGWACFPPALYICIHVMYTHAARPPVSPPRPLARSAL